MLILIATMDASREAFRAMIFYDYKRGLTFMESHENIQAAFGESALALTTISCWYRELKRGQESLSDDPRPGRPPKAVTHENVIRLEWLIQEDRNVIHGEIQD